MNLVEWDKKNGRRIFNVWVYGVEEVGVVVDFVLNF